MSIIIADKKGKKENKNIIANVTYNLTSTIVTGEMKHCDNNKIKCAVKV